MHQPNKNCILHEKYVAIIIFIFLDMFTRCLKVHEVTPFMSKKPLYCFSVKHKRKEFGFDLPADNDEDARALLQSLKQTVQLDGQLISTIPAWIPRYVPLSWYMKLQTIFQSS